MSLLQETQNQFANFDKTVSCTDLNVAGEIVTNALQLVSALPVTGFVLRADAVGNASWQQLLPPALCYGRAIGTAAVAVAAGAVIPFSAGAIVSLGFTSVPAAAGTTFVVATTGVYEFQFNVCAADAAGATVPLVITLEVNGVANNVLLTFRSDLATGDTGNMICTGSGILNLVATNTVRLRNVTNASGTAITLNQSSPGVNCLLMLKLIG